MFQRKMGQSLLLYSGATKELVYEANVSDQWGFDIHFLGDSGAALINDIDGDGISDILLGSQYFSLYDYFGEGQHYDGGAVFALSGKTGESLYGRIASENQEKALFGSKISIVGDINGDGFEDYLVGAPNSYTKDGQPGNAYLLSGVDGEQLRSFTGDYGGDRFGANSGPLGDIDGDGVPDFFIATQPMNYTNFDRPDYVKYISGASGETLRRQEMYDAPLGIYNGVSRYQTLGDVNGDGLIDLVVSNTSWGLMQGKVHVELTTFDKNRDGILDACAVSTTPTQSSPEENEGDSTSVLESLNITFAVKMKANKKTLSLKNTFSDGKTILDVFPENVKQQCKLELWGKPTKLRQAGSKNYKYLGVIPIGASKNHSLKDFKSLKKKGRGKREKTLLLQSRLNCAAENLSTKSNPYELRGSKRHGRVGLRRFMRALSQRLVN